MDYLKKGNVRMEIDLLGRMRTGNLIVLFSIKYMSTLLAATLPSERLHHSVPIRSDGSLLE